MAMVQALTCKLALERTSEGLALLLEIRQSASNPLEPMRVTAPAGSLVKKQFWIVGVPPIVTTAGVLDAPRKSAKNGSGRKNRLKGERLWEQKGEGTHGKTLT